MGPPKPKAMPSRRRQRDPMALLDKGLASSNSKTDLNSTAINSGSIPKFTTSTPFSSTMLSPDLIQQHANFSMISNISSVTQTSHGHTLNVHQNVQFHAVPKPDVLSSDVMNRIPWKDENKLKRLQRSPIAVTETLEQAFENRMSLEDVNNRSAVPKFTLNDDTLCDGSKTNEFSSSSENTVCEKDNFGCELPEMDTVMFTKKQESEEDLFNVSDSVLVKD
jgi:hypothetical protein